jgi:hypothetical protein
VIMSVGPFALDLANPSVRERLLQAQRDALAAQLPSTPRSIAPLRRAGALRFSLASGLRNLAVRLDPTLDCESRLAVPFSR